MITNTDEKQPEELTLKVSRIKPFENIALAFSGGGFRAATFALGVLAYLDRLEFDAEADALKGRKLLQQVTYMSSASGGTITAALYALYSARNKRFDKFYTWLYECLTGDFILRNALEILSDRKRWKNRPKKSRNIINAFSMAYDEYIFEGDTLKSLCYHGGGHLQEVCFNTTEFYTGLSFRQDRKMAPDPAPDPFYKFGNENIYLNQEVAAKLKLGDVLAASSCFPAGFEPLIFPDDFTHEQLDAPELKNGLTLLPQTGDKAEEAFIAEKNIGFMDGGITDNQGLQSMMYADGRRLRGETSFAPFDLMLVNDVGSYFIKPYINPPQPKHRGISLGGVNWIMIVVFLLAVSAAAVAIYRADAWLALAAGLVIVIPAISLWALRSFRRLITGQKGASSSLNLEKTFTEKVVRLLVYYFRRTPLLILKQMMDARMNSVLMLNMSVFLKRIRQLLYNRFYGSPEWKNRGKGNHIYDLAFSSDIYRGKNPPPDPFLNPSRDIQIVAQMAFNMGTTLWFDKTNITQQHSQGCIIAAGEFTTCYNLLSYIEKLLLNPDAFDDAYTSRLTALKAQLTADYTRFKAEPFFMYNRDGDAYGLKNFKPLSIKDIPWPENE